MSAAPGERLDALLVAVGSPHPISARVAPVTGIPPLGIGYLAAVLRRLGMRVRLLDLNVPGCSRARFERLVSTERPRVVGISCTTESYRNAIRLASAIRSQDRTAAIAVGGPHVTFEDAAALRTGAFDVVVRGEGESTAAELFPRLAAGEAPGPSIRGIAYRRGDEILRTEPRPLIPDLDTLPYPARDLLPLDRYPSPGAVVTGRGCPGRCPFCSASAMSGGRYRARAAEAVLDEVLQLMRAGIREILFLDDTLTADRARLERLLSLLDSRRVRISWSCQSRIESVDPSLLRWMARLGCHSIQYGIESGSSASRRRAGKGIARGGAEAVITATHRAGIAPVCSFIIGLPWESEAEVRGTIEFALRIQRLYLARVGFGILVCYPGTRLWRDGAQFTLRRRTRDFDAYTMYIPTCEGLLLDLEAQRNLHFEAILRQIRETPRALLEITREAVRPEGTAPSGP